jgi:hypothetical protein
VAPSANPTATIAGTDQEFDSLQSAIDAAPEGATIEISAGRFDERVTITKSLTIVGTSVSSTILGPEEETQLELSDSIEKASGRIDSTASTVEQSQPRREFTPDEVKEIREHDSELKRLVAMLEAPIITLNGNAKLSLRTLRVTMPLTPREDAGLPTASAINVNNASLSITDCLVIGCMGRGIEVTGDSELEVDDCLIAACWGAGIYSSADSNARVHIKNSHIRNNYHYNIVLGVKSCVIEGCQISGTPWSAIACGGEDVRIERNMLFANSRAIYTVGRSGVVRNNLICFNGAGASCWYDDQPLYVSNIFYKNAAGAILVAGPATPLVRRNLIVKSPVGVNYRPLETTEGIWPYARKHHVEQNVFWQVEDPLSATKSTADDAALEKLRLPESNQLVNPKTEIGDDEKLAIGNRKLARELGIEKMNGMTLQAMRLLFTPEEQAIIPDGFSLEAEDWKMRPKREP